MPYDRETAARSPSKIPRYSPALASAAADAKLLSPQQPLSPRQVADAVGELLEDLLNAITDDLATPVKAGAPVQQGGRVGAAQHSSVIAAAEGTPVQFTSGRVQPLQQAAMPVHSACDAVFAQESREVEGPADSWLRASSDLSTCLSGANSCSSPAVTSSNIAASPTRPRTRGPSRDHAVAAGSNAGSDLADAQDRAAKLAAVAAAAAAARARASAHSPGPAAGERSASPAAIHPASPPRTCTGSYAAALCGRASHHQQQQQQFCRGAGHAANGATATSSSSSSSSSAASTPAKTPSRAGSGALPAAGSTPDPFDVVLAASRRASGSGGRQAQPAGGGRAVCDEASSAWMASLRHSSSGGGGSGSQPGSSGGSRKSMSRCHSSAATTPRSKSGKLSRSTSGTPGRPLSGSLNGAAGAAAAIALTPPHSSGGGRAASATPPGPALQRSTSSNSGSRHAQLSLRRTRSPAVQGTGAGGTGQGPAQGPGFSSPATPPVPFPAAAGAAAAAAHNDLTGSAGLDDGDGSLLLLGEQGVATDPAAVQLFMELHEEIVAVGSAVKQQPDGGSRRELAPEGGEAGDDGSGTPAAVAAAVATGTEEAVAAAPEAEAEAAGGGPVPQTKVQAAPPLVVQGRGGAEGGMERAEAATAAPGGDGGEAADAAVPACGCRCVIM